MSGKLEGNDTTQETTIFGAIGIAIFLICAGVVYSIPNTFPEGTLYILAGVIIILVSIFNAFKGIGCNWSYIAIAIVSILFGANKVLDLGMGFLPGALIAVGIVSLFLNLNRLRAGKK